MIVAEIIRRSHADGLRFSLHGESDIRLLGDQSRITHWLPVIKQHKQEIIERLIDSQLEIIRQWLYRIGEPESGHHLVIDKCRNDPQALQYFLRHARGEFEAGYTLTDMGYSSPDDRIMCRDCLFLFGGHCQQNKVTNHSLRYRPVPDILKRCSVFKPRKGE